MAWSDAARQAALAARRAHAKAKSSFVKHGGPHFALNKTNAAFNRDRARIARGLRAVRSGLIPTYMAKGLSKAAVRATAYRNASRGANPFSFVRVHIPGYAGALVKAYDSHLKRNRGSIGRKVR